MFLLYINFAEKKGFQQILLTIYYCFEMILSMYFYDTWSPYNPFPVS